MCAKVMQRCTCFVLLLVFGVSGVVGYRGGAPLSQCDSMRPGHYGAKYLLPDGSEPYIITASKQQYSPGNTITVTVQTKADEPQDTTFAGLMLQARNTTGTRVGNFSVSGEKLQLLACGGVENTAVTHTSQLLTTTSISASWTAPTNETAGNVTFVATVVQRQMVIYEELALVLTFANLSDVTAPSSTDAGSSSGGNTTSGGSGGADGIKAQSLSIFVLGSLLLPVFVVIFA